MNFGPPDLPFKLEWNERWTTWDYHKIFSKYIYDGTRVVSDAEYKYASDFYDEFNSTARSDEWTTSEEWARMLFIELDDRGCFNVVKTQFPYPLHYDPACRDKGVYTERHANLQPPDNLILGVSSFSADHSTNVNAHDFQLVATALHFDAADDAYHKLKAEGRSIDEVEEDPTIPIQPRHKATHVIYAPSRYLLRWGAPDEPDGGAKFFAAIVGAFVVAWIILISFLTGGIGRFIRHLFVPVHHRGGHHAL